MSPLGYITAIHPCEIPYARDPEHGARWARAVQEKTPVKDAQDARRRESAFVLCDMIQARYPIQRRTCLADYTHLDWDRMELWSPERCSHGDVYQPRLQDRMAVFSDQANRLISQAFAHELEPPDYLFQVSCTGYDSPNAAQRLVVAKQWCERVRVLHIGHMGCYASLPALSLATDVLSGGVKRATRRAGASEHIRASFFSVELCSLHGKPLAVDPGSVVQQTLFADGAARVDVSNVPGKTSLAVLDTFELIVPGTLELMTWRPADNAFEMTLDVEVPRTLATRLRSIVVSMLAQNGLDLRDVGIFCVHPGGPRILESVEHALELARPATRHSHDVFMQRGNMSSATLPHIWHAVLSDPSVASGTYMCSLAFGPGLTVAGNILQKL
ncbi:MAG TPA: 3-oxoacyl-[acyl-carrier-protein] synthase III C-terminal domain-containing protein [Polyangiales bacterium]|jgi:predicted naringenin-chalcone synthase|nr:3-oxoacyl-[acyl-carrier-protein] synthase III C-terminal domain-containing protein [Polyangiales bacterium]